MAETLHVGNVGAETTDQNLQDLFAHAGTVLSAQVMTDAHTAKPRGFALVQMATPEEGEAAIRTLDGQLVGGRALSVRWLPLRAPGWRGGNGEGGGNRSHGLGMGNGGSRW